ncbi:hypothetical protein SAY87_015886 [Trapa incisa]|uniref:(+)-abscisic acid 8'-hydroxylase n=1 Tax=Trapa incisa TaxID=236973 RepID=A0AAN7QXK5_9MYRT|nr:hypothetical protein SAY87_015886 [Trapa incisa]
MQPPLLHLQHLFLPFSSSASTQTLVLLFSCVFVSALSIRALVRHSSSRRKKGGHLPPGSLGWPYLGETLKLYTDDPNNFFANREKRYGDVYKSHILGCPCVMVSSPEAIRLVLVTRAHMFKPTYPLSKERMIGANAIFFHQGAHHSRLRRLVQASFVPSALKGSVSDIERVVLDFLPSWKNCTINTLQEMKTYAFDVAILMAFGGRMEMEMKMKIKQLYQSLEIGYNSMPLGLPGTSFYRAMKARKLLGETLGEVMEERRRREGRREDVDDDEHGNGGKGLRNGMGNGGLLEVLMRANAINKGDGAQQQQQQKQLSDAQIADNIIGVIFAAHDTTASALTWVLKYLHDNPDVLLAVTREQEAIRSKMDQEDRGLSWEDTRQMPLTNRVILETLRAASILSFTFREAVEDVEINGYVIPKGWKVLPLFRSIHHRRDFFPDPDNFDPSRFEAPHRPNAFMPFGIGVHSCPGSELAKLEIFILLHHLTLTYRWEIVGDDDGIQYGPFPVPKHGLPIRVIERDDKPIIHSD